jgi:hypothetical protein
MRYEPMRGARLLHFVMFSIFGVVAIMLIAQTAAAGKNAPPVAFSVVWLFAAGWNGYWWLTRIATEITLEDRALHWSAPLSRGVVPVDELVEVRPMRLASNVQVFVCRDRRPVLVMTAKGLRAFTSELSAMRPDLPIRLGLQARILERMPGRSRFQR